MDLKIKQELNNLIAENEYMKNNNDNVAYFSLWFVSSLFNIDAFVLCNVLERIGVEKVPFNKKQNMGFIYDEYYITNSQLSHLSRFFNKSLHLHFKDLIYKEENE